MFKIASMERVMSCLLISFNTTLPGSSILEIEVWDHNDFFSDAFIGKTSVDIEDRFYDPNWLKLTDKPIETHDLIDQTSPGYKGNVSFWMEIIDKEQLKTLKKWDITQRPPWKLQMRLIVWETEDLPMVDVEGCSDFYVYGFVNEKSKVSTDVHFRNQDGAVVQ